MSHTTHELHDHEHEHPAGPHLLGLRPILRVANLSASLAYYTERLGFERSWAWSAETGFDSPAAPTFAQVARDHAVLLLAQQDQGAPGMWVYVDVNSAEGLNALHEAFAAAGAEIVHPPFDRPWGAREMWVRDLDGHTLRFAAPV
jgi:uncharacterized glyoxalase superfamily protein PhnB